MFDHIGIGLLLFCRLMGDRLHLVDDVLSIEVGVVQLLLNLDLEGQGLFLLASSLLMSSLLYL